MSLSDIQGKPVKEYALQRGGGVVVVCCSLHKTRTLFMNKICDFPTLFMT